MRECFRIRSWLVSIGSVSFEHARRRIRASSRPARVRGWRFLFAPRKKHPEGLSGCLPLPSGDEAATRTSREPTMALCGQGTTRSLLLLLVFAIPLFLLPSVHSKIINCAHEPKRCQLRAPLAVVDEERAVEKTVVELASSLPHWLIAFISVTPSVCFFGLQLSGWPTIQRIQCVSSSTVACQLSWPALRPVPRGPCGSAGAWGPFPPSLLLWGPLGITRVM